ncbi:flagellar basal body-associated FliL family protein [Helicobacter trogontum]|uniref:Flagellar protein FliL n=1 Tax=Helicobacter trogontum TaxID=50960 RepID=A0A099VQD2_9HELI|nr:flagellar basal body-associated FliL family protein [Helicobacter trogontum]MCI5787115.1 flagellar basal body-associated FliL family protein [Helicobacter trogontum]MDY5184487.1 flagellar basal body-associated FliL family protein [Helicobacter trogontum]TLD84294.1 flagellar basal body-associated FliL family protein [Helicobacter trogontum]TLD99724.1 flagellar basal body-associated FliL family protein [Helicobacter trogontum]
MKRILFVLLCIFSVGILYADSNTHYGIYRNAKDLYPIEKEFVMMLKPSNPDDLRSAGYIKFNATMIMSDKSAAKELDVKIDIIRAVIIDTVSGFMKTDLQGAQGKQKLAATLTASVNAILTDSSIVGFVFPDLVIQP